MEQWKGKVAIVTDVTTGRIEAIAKALVNCGLHVITLTPKEDKMKDLAKKLKTARGTLHPVRCDMRDEEEIVEAFHFACNRFGGVDILINNAEVSFAEDVTEGKTENFRAILDINVLAPAIATREAVRSMRSRRTDGHIIFINSVLGRNANAGYITTSLYPASKYALDALAANVRDELKSRKTNVKVTTIHVGVPRNELSVMLDPDAGVTDMLFQLPPLTPDDIANAIVYALSSTGNVQINELTIQTLR